MAAAGNLNITSEEHTPMIKHYDTQEAIPDAQRAAAIETKDGKWLVDESPSEEALKEAGQRALAAERTARDAAEKARVKAEGELAEVRRTQQAKADGISEAQLTKLREDEAAARKPLNDQIAELNDQIAELKERLAAMTQSNRKLTLTDRVQRLALDAGVMPERIEDAMLHIDRRTSLTEAGTIVVLDKTGEATAETIDHFLSETFRAEKDYLYRGHGAAGGGSGDGDRPPRERVLAPAASQTHLDTVRGAL